MTMNLPPLRPFDTYPTENYYGGLSIEREYCDDGLYVHVEDVEARERILLARIEELERDLANARLNTR